MYEYNDWGWYIGNGTGQRTTETAPSNMSVEEAEGELRSNWTGYEWIELPYVKPPSPISALAAKKLEAINQGKSAALDGGFVHNGILFDSDSKARLAYLEFGFKLASTPAYSTPWKASTGQWVQMDAALFAALQPAYEAHIQGCFAWQAAREEDVAAAVTAGDVEALRAVAEIM